MTRKKWFRVYHGLPADMTLAVAAHRAGLSRGDMIALWLCLLDHASRTEPAGTIAGFAEEETALILGLSTAQLGMALDALRDKKKIDAHQRITGWDRFQPSSSARVRAMRNKRKVIPSPPAVAKSPPATAATHDSPAEIAARRARLQQNNTLIIGQQPRP